MTLAWLVFASLFEQSVAPLRGVMGVDSCVDMRHRSFSGRGTVVDEGGLIKCVSGVCVGISWDLTLEPITCIDASDWVADQGRVIWAATPAANVNGWNWMNNFSAYTLADLPVLPGIRLTNAQPSTILMYLYLGIRVLEFSPDLPFVTSDTIDVILEFLTENPSECVLLSGHQIELTPRVVYNADLATTRVGRGQVFAYEQLCNQYECINPSLAEMDFLVPQWWASRRTVPIGIFMFDKFGKTILKSLLGYAMQYKFGHFTIPSILIN